MAAPTYGDLMGFTDHFLQAARRRADEPIFVDDQRRITGAEAHHSVRALARRLVSVSEPQAVVAFFCAGSARHAVTWFAAAHAGRIACNLHLRETPEKLAPVLRWLEPDVVVYDAASAELATRTVELAELTVTTPSLRWSPDSCWIATAVIDVRNCPTLTMVDSVPPDQFRPKAYETTTRYQAITMYRPPLQYYSRSTGGAQAFPSL